MCFEKIYEKTVMQNQYNSKATQISLLFLLFISASLLAGYWPFIKAMLNFWNDGDNSYCYLVVPLCIYLCWEKKDEFFFGQFTWSHWGLMPALLSASFVVIGELGSVKTLSYIGLWGCVTSVVVTLYGWRRCRQLFFPLLVLFFIVPLPPYINRMLTFNMKMMASSLSVEMLRGVGVSVMQNGNILDLGITKLQVVDACSGLRYIVSMILMSLLIGHFFVNGLWRKIVLLILVYPLTILINSLRIFVTGFATLHGYNFLLEEAYHDAAGLVAFGIAGVLLYGTAKLLGRSGSSKKDKTVQDRGSRSYGFATPLALTLSLCLLFAGSGVLVKDIAAKMIIPERENFASFPMEISGWQGEPRILSEEIVKGLGSDDYVAATFSKDGLQNTIHLLIPYYNYQDTSRAAHAPQSCILGSGWDMEHSTIKSFQITPQEKLDVGLMQLRQGDLQMLGSYFFFQRGRVVNDPWKNKYYQIIDALLMGRTDGALVRVEMTLAKGQNLQEAEKMLQEFFAGLWPQLVKYIPDVTKKQT